ncbi:hypothetical protein GCM10009544_17300 [Streptomyces stramineus]|uniref:Transposase IS701-like DDE domain-containing protein n=1 Tax=Streptomyces stramineus TaxID=173861 RepID=A0ABP3JIR2_9ACTN
MNRGHFFTDALQDLLISLPLPRFAGRLVLTVDVSPWLRSDAACSPERLFCRVHDRLKAATQIIPGSPYSCVAALTPDLTSWTAVLDAVRLGPADDVVAVTADQLRQVVQRLIAAGQWRHGDRDVLIVMDAGYDVAWDRVHRRLTPRSACSDNFPGLGQVSRLKADHLPGAVAPGDRDAPPVWLGSPRPAPPRTTSNSSGEPYAAACSTRAPPGRADQTDMGKCPYPMRILQRLFLGTASRLLRHRHQCRSSRQPRRSPDDGQSQSDHPSFGLSAITPPRPACYPCFGDTGSAWCFKSQVSVTIDGL